MTDHIGIPRATDTESQTLDHIDTITWQLAPDSGRDDIDDILDEAMGAEQLLAESRTATWLKWAKRIGCFDIYLETMRAHHSAAVNAGRGCSQCGTLESDCGAAK